MSWSKVIGSDKEDGSYDIVNESGEVRHIKAKNEQTKKEEKPLLME